MPNPRPGRLDSGMVGAVIPCVALIVSMGDGNYDVVWATGARHPYWETARFERLA